MPNIIDYMAWRADVPLEIAPFNPVDNLILSQLAYLDFSEALSQTSITTLREAATKMQPNSERDAQLLAATAGGARLGDARVSAYVSELDPDEEKQFAAVTFELADGSAYVAYRGTDDTLVGWKEDFNLAFATPVPAQLAAVRYLDAAAARLGSILRVGGHSKGGNLAVYAAAYASDTTHKRILLVYSNDGPGQSPETILSPGYLLIQPRIRSYIPQSSIVGMLLNPPEDYTVVLSDARGLLQHDPYTWQVQRDGFITVSDTTPGSDYLNLTIREWLASMSSEQRRSFIDALFDFLGASKEQTFEALIANWRKSAPALLRSLREMDAQTARMLMAVGAQLLTAAVRSCSSPEEKIDI